MNELRDWVQNADPVAHEPPLSDADAQRMRRAIVAASESPLASSFADWARGSWAVATVVVALTIAVSMTRWSKPSDDVRSVNVDAAPSAVRPGTSARRQLQVIAPGGTRVIWIFNDEFNP